MTTTIDNFLLRGLFAKGAVEDLQNSGALRPRAATQQERNDADLFAPLPEVIRNASAQMQRYYRMLFVFENAIRDFIVTRFLEVDGSEWFEKRASLPMKNRVKTRRDGEARNGWHIGRNAGDINYLDFGDLELLIKNHWDLFKDLLPDQAWLTSRLQEGERTRNVIMHTNVLAAEEGQRLELYLRDWLRQTV